MLVSEVGECTIVDRDISDKMSEVGPGNKLRD